MDLFDTRILDALQIDGRLGNNELAEKVGLSPSQCSRRRIALEEQGVIAGYHASLSAEALGLDVVVFVQVTLSSHSPDNGARFKQLIDNLDMVLEAYSLTGASDYLVKIMVPNLKELARVLNEVFLPHGSVSSVRSSIVLERIKQTHSLPLPRKS